MANETLSYCTLCGLEIQSSPLVDDKNAFCCTGCHAVYNVLSSRNEIDKGLDHPLFQQAISSGLISNPHLLEQQRKKREKIDEENIEREKLYFSIQGLWCPSCSLLIQYILLQKKGIIRCSVDYSTDMAYVEYQPRYLDKATIFESIKKLGYEIDSLEDAQLQKNSKSLTLRAVITGFFALNVMMFAYPLYATFFDESGAEMGLLFAWLSFFAAIPVMTYGAMPIYRRFLGALKTGFFGMETLVVLGTGSACLLSIYKLLQNDTHVYFDTAVVIIALVLAGKVTENHAKFNAKQTLFRLAKSQPRRGRKVQDDGTASFVPIEEIHPGDLVRSYMGERVILDGEVVEGEGTVDESLLTGESLPVSKQIGAKLIGGSVVLQGNLTWKVTTTLEDSLQQRILELVRHDIGSKTPKENLVQIILRYFIPAILLLALVSWFISGEFEQALAVLLIACPCALGIAIPLVEAQLIQKCAQSGAIIRNRSCLQILGEEDEFIFDKTGTVTQGYFEVLEGAEHLSDKVCDAIGAIAKQSTHPVAYALARQWPSDERVNISQEFAGLGMEGSVDGMHYSFGSKKFMSGQGIALPQDSPLEPGKTFCYLAQKQQFVAKLILGDRLREEIIPLVKQLRPHSSTLLSGDSEQAVAAVAHRCGFTDYLAEQSPLQKREYILKRKEEGKKVLMVGDGINDAPALTAADIGVSVVSATDISIQVSDILLTTDSLSTILTLRELSIKARKLVRQNLFWTFFYNLIGIGLALTGHLSPIYSAFAMVASSLIVVCNARRL